MKISYIILLISSTLFYLSSQAQTYTKYMQEGKDFFNKSEYMSAFDRFDIASDLAASEADKTEARSWKKKSREKIIETLQKVELMQKKVETAMFDKAVKDQYREWKGYINYESKKERQMILNGIEKLDLSSCALLGLPKEVPECSNLKSLNLLKNSDIDLAVCLVKLLECKQLTELDLSFNQINNLPTETGKLVQLTKLYLNENQLVKLPPENGNLKNLQTIYLHGNKLADLPSEMAKLKNLTIIVLENNEFTVFPEEITYLKGLTGLSLNLNRIKILPPGIGNLTALNKLFLSNNKITKLPAETGNLINLTELELSYNRITEVPPQTGNLKNLIYLGLANNQIKILPVQMGELTNLAELNLESNELTSLPVEMGALTNLKYLNLRNNNFPDSEKQKIINMLPGCQVEF